PSDESPSMVIIGAAPTSPTWTEHERSGSPPRNTIHAPHCAIPQPNFVPVRPSSSRSTQSKGVSASTSTSYFLPFTFRTCISPLRLQLNLVHSIIATIVLLGFIQLRPRQRPARQIGIFSGSGRPFSSHAEL